VPNARRILPLLIRLVSESLLAAKGAAQQHLDVHYSILDNLDEFGEIMTEMLHRQETVEARRVEF
jgi:hypothetical protein